MAKHKLVAGPHGADVAVEGHSVGEEFELSKARAAELRAQGYQLEEVSTASSNDGGKGGDK